MTYLNRKSFALHLIGVCCVVLLGLWTGCEFDIGDDDDDDDGSFALETFSVSSTRIDLTWDYDLDPEEGFTIERDSEFGGIEEIAQLDAGVSWYSDSALIPGTRYTYRVCGYGPSGIIGCSSWSSSTTFNDSRTMIFADHTSTDIDAVPADWIEQAKETLHIAYGHTSHGSQLTTGMAGLVSFLGDEYAFASGGTGGALDLRDTPFSGARDLGNPDRTSWAIATRNYLDAHPEVNVVIWSWCGQVSTATEDDIETYLSLMTGLEEDYPDAFFVYMTGHLDGTGLEGNLHLRNTQIRTYCRENAKILYDFADIETYDPDGTYFGDKYPDDGCNYDSDGNGSLDANWAIEWQESHVLDVDWYDCPSAHSQPLNANLKAYAAWWLWARLAGWPGE